MAADRAQGTAVVPGDERRFDAEQCVGGSRESLGSCVCGDPGYESRVARVGREIREGEQRGLIRGQIAQQRARLPLHLCRVAGLAIGAEQIDAGTGEVRMGNSKPRLVRRASSVRPCALRSASSSCVTSASWGRSAASWRRRSAASSP